MTPRLETDRELVARLIAQHGDSYPDHLGPEDCR